MVTFFNGDLNKKITPPLRRWGRNNSDYHVICLSNIGITFNKITGYPTIYDKVGDRGETALGTIRQG